MQVEFNSVGTAGFYDFSLPAGKGGVGTAIATTSDVPAWVFTQLGSAMIICGSGSGGVQAKTGYTALRTDAPGRGRGGAWASGVVTGRGRNGANPTDAGADAGLGNGGGGASASYSDYEGGNGGDGMLLLAIPSIYNAPVLSIVGSINYLVRTNEIINGFSYRVYIFYPTAGTSKGTTQTGTITFRGLA